MTQLKWGVLGAAGIARKMFLPAIATCGNATVAAIASRSAEKAEAMAEAFDITTIYGDYDALLTDPNIDAVYVPLPNHRHVDMTISALEAGKHVLCEKPIAMAADEVLQIQTAARETGKSAVEGFMVAYHPQWDQVRAWIADGKIGRIQRIEGYFTYYLDDPSNIRNREDGGALRDVGVYPIFTTRLVTGQEPRRVLGRMSFDKTAEADLSTSAWMEFDGFDAAFHVNTRADRSENLTIFGTHGRIEVPNAYNPPNSGVHKIFRFAGNALAETAMFQDVFQFAEQLAHLSDVFAGKGAARVSLENSWANQRVVDAIRLSAAKTDWVSLSAN